MAQHDSGEGPGPLDDLATIPPRDLEARLERLLTGRAWRVEREEDETSVTFRLWAPGEEKPTRERYCKFLNEDGTQTREYGGSSRANLPHYFSDWSAAGRLVVAYQLAVQPRGPSWVAAPMLVDSRDDSETPGDWVAGSTPLDAICYAALLTTGHAPAPEWDR